MVDRRGGGDAWHRGDPLRELGAGRAGGRGHGDVGAERQLCIDHRLLIVGRSEDPQVDAKREQQADHEKAAVDGGAATTCAGEHQATERSGATAAGRVTARRARGHASRTSSSAEPIHSSAGAKNMYTESDSVGFESGLTTAENPVLTVSQ